MGYNMTFLYMRIIFFLIIFTPFIAFSYNPHSVSAFMYVQAPFAIMSSIPQPERKHVRIGLVRLYLTL